MDDCNPRKTPFADNSPIDSPSPEDTERPELKEQFQKTIGELRYIADSTRPDIFYAVNRLAQATHNPIQRHWNTLKLLMRYLKQTINHGVMYKSNKSNGTANAPPLTSYSDADFANDNIDRKSISGGVHLLYKSPIIWKSNKQQIQAHSTCEAEYISGTTAAQYTNWIRRMLFELHILDPKTPTPFYIDNEAAIKIATNQAPTRKRKFIHLRYHYLRDRVQTKNIAIKHIDSANMIADIFTKPLPRQRFLHNCSLLQVENPPEHELKRTPSSHRQGDC